MECITVTWQQDQKVVVTRALSSPTRLPGSGPGTHQVDKHTHVFLRQPMEEVSRVAGQDLIIMQCGDGLNTLLQLLQAWLHALHLQWEGGTTNLSTCPLSKGSSSPAPFPQELPPR